VVSNLETDLAYARLYKMPDLLDRKRKRQTESPEKHSRIRASIPTERDSWEDNDFEEEYLSEVIVSGPYIILRICSYY
jgi:hypothetical protein